MIRGIDTLRHNFALLEKRQEMISGNIANIETPGYKAKKIIQGTEGAEAFSNHLGGIRQNELAELGTAVFHNRVEEVYEHPENLQVPVSELDGTLTELSNVDATEEIISLMQVSREYEANQKLLHANDELLKRASNEIGKV